MPYQLAVAPMMDCTDRHDRYFLRLIAPDVRLYTEMITSQALIHGNIEKLIQFDPKEKYLALQLGGNDPQELAHCAKLGEGFGYDEINLNVGCPSDRVKAGRFGACLMLEPHTVAEAIFAMQHAVSIPVTVKCRIGVDQKDSHAYLHHFISKVAEAGCQTFIIHARKAWLSGLSPKENRTIPPLEYERVWQVKRDFPHLTIMVNGGLKTLSDIEAQVPYTDGAMIGRAAYANPYCLAKIQAHYYDASKVRTREEVITHYLPYVREQIKNHVKLSSITRHLFGLYHGEPGARFWRRYLSTHAHVSGAGVEVIEQALRGINS